MTAAVHCRTSRHFRLQIDTVRITLARMSHLTMSSIRDVTRASISMISRAELL